MFKSNRKRRMLFACTHVTLRETELPVWMDAGIEVIPEEANAGVLNKREVMFYDDPDMHPALKRAIQESTLSEHHFRILSRIRLYQRRGLISVHEIELINNLVDVIYVATDLETAVNVRRWFRGNVIFRYFGKFSNLSDISVDVRKYSSNEISGIICVPIFNSLYELGIRDFFPKTAALHGYVPRELLGEKWQGVQINQPAVIVINNIHAEDFRSDLIANLREISRVIPLEVLGKNDLERIPKDFKSEVNVIGMLDRQEFLSRLANARFLIHPYGEKYHNHYTNIEAVVKNVPVIFLANNPLYYEQSKSLKEGDDQRRYGVYYGDRDLFLAAEGLYRDESSLKKLSKSQQDLLGPFSRASLDEEVATVIKLFKTDIFRSFRRNIARHYPDDNSFPQSKVSISEALKAQDGLAAGEWVPFHAFFLGDDWNLLEIHADNVVAALRRADGVRQFVLGRERPFPSGHHQLDFKGRVHAGSAFKAVAEIYHGETRVGYTSQCKTVEGDLNVRFDIFSPKPWLISFYLEAPMGKHVEISHLRLVRSGATANRSGIFEDEFMKIGETLPALLPFGQERRMYRLPPLEPTAGGGDFEVVFRVSAMHESPITMSIEMWRGEAIESVVQVDQIIASGVSFIRRMISVPAGNGSIIPIVFSKGIDQDMVTLMDISFEKTS